jgi:hypothetical protein
LNLFINYYDNPKRQKELDFCLEKNLANDLIKKVVIFNESKRKFKNDKVLLYDVGKRPTYQDFFDLTREFGEDDINIISNTDIFFDDSLREAEHLKPHMCYALTRHELRGNIIYPFEKANSNVKAAFSQDVWMFRGPCRATGCEQVVAMNMNTNTYENIPFTMGIPGCDNIIAVRLKEKYQVKNPHEYIRCIHVHEELSRPGYMYRITGSNRGQWGEVHRGHLNGTTL